MTSTFWKQVLGLTLATTAIPLLSAASPEELESLSDALTFHASYNHGIDADYAKGDGTLHTCLQNRNQSDSVPGLRTDGKTQHSATEGLGGGALRFTARNARWLYYAGAENVRFTRSNWQGTVSLWLRLDPETELDPGFTDPIQLTPRKWNDAAFFVDFNKDGDPRDFRLGAFPDLKVWNADNQNVNNIPESERPLASVSAPPFSKDAWTHVVFTWERFNTGKKDGVAKLYLNGKLSGEVKGWDQTYSWSSNEETRLFIGLNYIGLFDELSCFDRALTAEEVASLTGLKDKIPSVLLSK